MRISIGILGGIVLLFVGIFAINESAEQAYEPAVTNGSNASASAYNTSEAVIQGVAQSTTPYLVYAGVAAFILVSLGILLVASQRGGR